MNQYFRQIYIEYFSIRLWEEGWKERYYQSKCCVSCDDVEFVRKVVENYAQGLCWVMSYYYQVI